MNAAICDGTAAVRIKIGTMPAIGSYMRQGSMTETASSDPTCCAGHGGTEDAERVTVFQYSFSADPLADDTSMRCEPKTYHSGTRLTRPTLAHWNVR